ncbi:hypothetical protein [Acinetobacter soli]|uniref:hypothetical protein n=1 Tax=Acinetobacter soli TaxID=487316 RepID=UPI00125DA3F3|nr:hypothetical protein [Acinetobacter soli]
MELYYFGISKTLWFGMAVVVLLAILYFIFRNVINNDLTRNKIYSAIVAFCGCMTLLYISEDLDNHISKSDASKLQNYYVNSLNNANGYDFKKELSDLMDQKHVLLYGDMSYLGSDIYTQYVSKNDWNRLAKIYNKTISVN